MINVECWKERSDCTRTNNQQRICPNNPKEDEKYNAHLLMRYFFRFFFDELDYVQLQCFCLSTFSRRTGVAGKGDFASIMTSSFLRVFFIFMH
mmetsp:Transcript_21336/g.50507  ORF Transcript_21336/g.50507 Transcript_21336/m.50507 type:complete len:93 (+) Transcript_21336:102-380(+)